MNLKGFAIFTILLLMALPSIASADVTNSTIRAVTDVAYPQEIFYALLAIAVILFFAELCFIIMKSPPPSAMAICGALGMGLFYVCGMMAPMVAKFYIISDPANGVTHVADYIFSPWVSQLMNGFASLMLLFTFYGVLVYFKLTGEYKERMAKQKEEAYFDGIWDINQ